MENRDSARTCSCPACQSSSSWLLDAVDQNRRVPGRFTYFRCDNCRLVFIERIPPDLAKYYIGGYQQKPQTLEELRRMAAPESFRMKCITRYHQGGRLLEIGPWIGLFSCLAKDSGFDVTALEINQDCVDFLRTTVGIHAIQSSDPAHSLLEMSDHFDVIALWHSIEHLPHPWRVIEAAAHRLTPGGILLVAAPNPDSAQFSILRERWYHLDAPRHLYFMPDTLVTQLGQKNGLELVLSTTDDPLGRVLDRLGWDAFVGSLVPIPGLRRLTKRLATPALTMIHRSRQDGRGAGYTCILRKPSS